MAQVNDLSRSLVSFEQSGTLVVVLEMSQSSWLAAGVVPGVERRPLKKISPDPAALLHLVERWRDQAVRAGQTVTRAVLAFEAGRDGFWLARWLRARDIETYVVHSTSVAVSREHRRAKTDRLDTEMLIRVFLGWLRGEPRHCKMVAIPTLEEEDAKRPSRERENLVGERTRIINRMKAALTRLGVRGFKPELLKAPERLEAMRTPEGVQIPPNMLDELRRDMASNRASPVGSPGAGSGRGSRRNGSTSGARRRRGSRDGGHVGSRDLVSKPTRSASGRPLCRRHRIPR
jgi:transposase